MKEPSVEEKITIVVFVGIFLLALAFAALLAGTGCVRAPKITDKPTNICILNLSEKACYWDKASGSSAPLDKLDGWYMLDAEDMAEILFKIKTCDE